jgi:hypothetical protein
MYLKVRRSLTDYGHLRKDDEFPQYQRRIISTSKAHETYFIIDLDTDPMESCGHDEIVKHAQAYMYLLVFTETLLTAKGIEFVKDHPGDARKVWNSLVTYYTGQSTHARLSANRYYKQGHHRLPHPPEESEEV